MIITNSPGTRIGYNTRSTALLFKCSFKELCGVKLGVLYYKYNICQYPVEGALCVGKKSDFDHAKI
jgi:hypothetical protein